MARSSRIGRMFWAAGVLIAVAQDASAMVLTAPPAEPSLLGYMGLLKDKRLEKRDSADYCAGTGSGKAWNCAPGTCYSAVDGWIGCCDPTEVKSCAVRTTCIPYTPGVTPSCHPDKDGCLPCNSDRPNCVYQTNIKMNQYIFYCDSVAPQTITLSFDNPKTGVLVTPSGWSSGPPKPSHPPSASSPSLTSGSPNPPSQISTSSHTATPSPIPVTKTLSSGIIAAISLAAVAIIAVLSATLFWFCIRPWLKRRKGQPAQQITHIIVQENNNFPWGPDSIAAKAPSRHSIPYPESRSELPAHSPHEFSDDKRPLDIGSDEESNMDTIGETHSRGPRDSDISPLSPYLEPSSTHSMISGPPSPPMDRGGAVSPVSLPGADSARRPTVFSFLTPGNATARQLDVDDDDDDDDDGEDDGGQLGGHLELEGSPRFHTRGSMRRKRDSNPKELDSKRNSTPKESDSKRASGLQEQPPTHREEDEEAER